MLKILLLVSSFLLGFSSISAQIASSCNGSPAFNTAYDKDIKEMAIQNMLASGTADSNSINVLPSYYQDISRALAAIANTSSVSNEADSIFNLYCMHNGSSFGGGLSNSALWVNLDPNIAWTSNWLNNTTLSGNPTIDSLLAGQSYTVTSNGGSTLPYLVTIAFNDVLNTKPIIEQLTGLSGIDYVEDISFFGGGNRITHTKVGNSSYLDFNLGWGDCASGCTKRKVWSFAVDLTTCNVLYLGVTGDDLSIPDFLPHQSNCNLILSTTALSNTLASIQVFPNPATDLIHVEGTLQQIKLYNSVGNLVFQQHINSELATIDVNHLPKGIYWLVVNDAVTKTIVKQ